MRVINIFKKYRHLALIILDCLIIALSLIISNLFIDNKIIYGNILLREIFLSILVYEVFLNILQMYSNMTRYEVTKDYIKYIIIGIVSTCILIVLNNVLHLEYLTTKVLVLSGIFISSFFILYRLLLRSIVLKIENKKYKLNNNIDETNKSLENVLIIGAGLSAREIILAIQKTMKNRYNIVGIVDDDVNKLKKSINGIKVLGTRVDIPKIVKEKDVNIIFFSIAKISSISRREIIEICEKTGVKTRVLPNIEEIIDREGAINCLRDVEIEDLLGRDPIKLDNKGINSYIKDKTVLVTGGGGSIGSELCRQIAIFNPKELVILDIYENNLYDIEMELKSHFPKAKITAIVGSVRDKKRLNNIFSEYKPEIVFHAAAHKHVPLMENSPLEAIKNNVLGTLNVVNCADIYKTKRFVLISTDKAVNPTNVMGASKRVCEMIVQAKNKVSNTEYVAVRFGNVLGSNGSVIPLFKKQIKEGGPITLTHKDITRFFMTIPEAVGLILEAATYAKGGEIFVLDMGEPVKIYDLAIKLIKLSGLEPGVDIDIKITGLRPGEKLYEELLMAEEGLTATKHDKIFISAPGSIEMNELEKMLSKLESLEYTEDFSIQNIKETLKAVVPTYKEPNEDNQNIDNKRRKK